MRSTVSYLPRTLLLAAVVLTVCCADGGAIWHGGFPTTLEGRADLTPGEARHRAAASRYERPSRREVRPTVAVLRFIAHAPTISAPVRPRVEEAWLDGACLSFAESCLPPPAVA